MIRTILFVIFLQYFLIDNSDPFFYQTQSDDRVSYRIIFLLGDFFLWLWMSSVHWWCIRTASPWTMARLPSFLSVLIDKCHFTLIYQVTNLWIGFLNWFKCLGLVLLLGQIKIFLNKGFCDSRLYLSIFETYCLYLDFNWYFYIIYVQILFRIVILESVYFRLYSNSLELRVPHLQINVI